MLVAASQPGCQLHKIRKYNFPVAEPDIDADDLVIMIIDSYRVILVILLLKIPNFLSRKPPYHSTTN